MKIQKAQNIDYTFWALYIALVVVAVISLFSASSTLVYSRGSVLGPIGSQMIFILVGIVVAYAMQFLSSYAIRKGGYVILGISILLVYSLLVPSNPFIASANGAARWLRIAGFQFQPSEFAKLSLIIVIADQLSQAHTDQEKKKYFFRSLLITAITVLPIMTSNLSTAILISGIVFLLWILARMPAKYVLPVVGAVVGLLIVGYIVVEFAFVRPHREMGGLFGRATTWVSRIDRMTNKDKTTKFELTDENRQETYANVAIARGGKSPFGVLPGNSKERDYLPLAFADYIFAIIVEESGVVGAAVLMFIYLAILFRACIVSNRFADTSSMLMVMGLALMISCQALLSMMVAVGIGPVTGQPLPLISRGGTSVIITSIYFGIMMSVSREQMSMHNRQKATQKASQEDVPDIVLEKTEITRPDTPLELEEEPEIVVEE